MKLFLCEAGWESATCNSNNRHGRLSKDNRVKENFGDTFEQLYSLTIQTDIKIEISSKNFENSVLQLLNIGQTFQLEDENLRMRMRSVIFQAVIEAENRLRYHLNHKYYVWQLRL